MLHQHENDASNFHELISALDAKTNKHTEASREEYQVTRMMLRLAVEKRRDYHRQCIALRLMDNNARISLARLKEDKANLLKFLLFLTSGNLSEEENKLPTISLAAKHKKFHRALDMLVEAGANVNPVASHGGPSRDPPLALAAATANTSTVARLLKHGAVIDAVDRKGNTALMNAAKAANAGNVALLLQEKANPGLKNNKGKVAAKLATNNAIKKMLSEGGAGDEIDTDVDDDIDVAREELFEREMIKSLEELAMQCSERHDDIFKGESFAHEVTHRHDRSFAVHKMSVIKEERKRIRDTIAKELVEALEASGLETVEKETGKALTDKFLEERIGSVVSMKSDEMVSKTQTKKGMGRGGAGQGGVSEKVSPSYQLE